MSTYPTDLVQLIHDLRFSHEGWGATTLLIELEDYGYSPSELPSVDSVNRYLKQAGFIKERLPSNAMPKSDCKKAKKSHDLWEMDAQGAVKVKGLNAVAMINLKDQHSKIHCMAFPVAVKNTSTQPKTDSYLWAMRLAFEQWGLPKAIQVDKDSVFIDNRSKSPFPSKVHLLLIGLGVKLCFIDVPPPQKQSMVERSHQTMDRQVLREQEYNSWQQLFTITNKRRKKLNEKYPNRMLGKVPPLTAFPQAIHSGRAYKVEIEGQLFDMKKVFRFLSKCRWYRKVSQVKTVSLGSKIYYLKNAKGGTQIQIQFCNRSKKLIFQDANELVVAKISIKDFSMDYIRNASTEKIIATKKLLFKNRGFPL